MSAASERDVRLLLACAQEYADSARACDTPSLRRFRRERQRKADALRDLAKRLTRVSVGRFLEERDG